MISGQSAAWNHTMKARMMLQGLSPGMKHGEEADPGPQVLRVGGDLQQCFGGGLEQQVVDDSFVLERQGRELFWQGENYMVVVDGQQFLGAGLHPLSSGCGLALSAMA